MPNDMNPVTLLAAGAAALRQATVVRVEGDGTVVVTPAGPDGEEVLCGVLETGALVPLLLAARDEVLVWQPEPHVPRGVLLGRVGISHADDRPDELVIEAGKTLTLRVGDGSITLRADGKIQIKGKDLVSHAQRLNRIKGGAVSIN
jgi:hypothetical protein